MILKVLVTFTSKTNTMKKFCTITTMWIFLYAWKVQKMDPVTEFTCTYMYYLLTESEY